MGLTDPTPLEPSLWLDHAAHLLDQLSGRLYDLEIAQRTPSAHGARERYARLRDYLADVDSAIRQAPSETGEAARLRDLLAALLAALPARLEDVRVMRPCLSPPVCAFDWSFLESRREPVPERCRDYELRSKRVCAFRAEARAAAGAHFQSAA